MLACAWSAGAPVERAAGALRAVAPVAGRGVRYHIPVEDGLYELIDESYNASPAAVRAAITTLAETEPLSQGGRRLAVLGDMLELGEAAVTLACRACRRPGSSRDRSRFHQRAP